MKQTYPSAYFQALQRPPTDWQNKCFRLQPLRRGNPSKYGNIFTMGLPTAETLIDVAGASADIFAQENFAAHQESKKAAKEHDPQTAYLINT
jgi:hypothetical protein